MPIRIDHLTRSLERRAGTSHALVRQIEAKLGNYLPSDYVHFLALTDGAQRFIGGPDSCYVVLRPIERILVLNGANKINEYAPVLVLFGSDGRGNAYAFDLTSGPMPVPAIPFVPMDRKEANVLASSFSEFLVVLHCRTDSR